jgi:hypothetical protein
MKLGRSANGLDLWNSDVHAKSAPRWAGVPIDIETLGQFRDHWTGIQDSLIARIDTDYNVFEGRTFKAAKFAAWLEHTGIPWPRRETGALDLSDDAFRQAARSCPEVAPLRELRSALWDLRLNDLAVGRDGRVLENLLWFFTEPGDTVVDLFVKARSKIEVIASKVPRAYKPDASG